MPLTNNLWYISSVKYNLVATWAASTAYSVGAFIRQLATPTQGNERVFRCTVAGTTGATEPAWNLGGLSTTVSGTATFQEITGRSAYGWAAAFPRILAAMNGVNSGNAYDTFYLAHDHNETTTVNWTISTGGFNRRVELLCVDSTVSVPTNSDLRTTAVINTPGTTQMQLGNAYIYGVTFNLGTGTTAVTQYLTGCFLDTCKIVGITTALTLATSSSNYGSITRLTNTPIVFAGVGSGLRAEAGQFTWDNTPNAIQGVVPTSLILSNGLASYLHFENLDLSAIASGKIFASLTSTRICVIHVRRCKFGAGAVMSSLTPANYTQEMSFIDMEECGVSTEPYKIERYRCDGTQVTETILVRTNGMSIQGTPVSWKLTTTTGPEPVSPFEAISINKYNAKTGINLTAKIHGIYNGTTAPNNSDISMTVFYPGKAGTTQRAKKSSYLITTTVAANPADTGASWDSLATSRTNSEVVTLNTIRKVSSNSGRVFICTTAGTCSSSLPAGYATAVDGGSVTDGTAVFRAMYRFSISVPIDTPQVQYKGVIQAQVRVGKASTIYYIDPCLEIT